jgi:hypothetical protein
MTALCTVKPSEAYAGLMAPSYKIAQQSKDKGVIGIVMRSSMATLMTVGGMVTTNDALSYNFHYETAITNPSVSLPNHEEDWFDEESPMLASFMGFLEQQMNEHPELVVPADEDQLARIEALVAGVRL